MKYCYILFFISVSYFLSAQENVGIGTLTPHSSSILELKSFDKGILIPRMKTNARLAIVDPDPGLCVYDATTQSFWYYDQFWREVNETDAFINDNGLVRNNGNIATDDFLFGSFDLPTGTAHDTMMFFDRSKAALRAGDVQSTAWIADSIGHASIALGYNPRASGDYSVSLGDRTEATALASTAIGTLSEATGMFATAIGNFTQASGPASVALGDQTDADGLGSTALGRLTLASGDYATAAGNLSIASGASSVAMGSQAQATRTAAISIGLQTQATGSYSTAFGRTTKAESNNTFALGRFNVGGGHQSLWYDNDPLFEIGNGSDTSNLHNAFTILKNGKTGIGTASPDTNFTVVGVSRAAMDTSETDYIEMSHGGNNAYINVVGTGNLDIRYQDANIMTLANDQNVGIGTNSPDTKLSVIGKVRGAIGVSEQEYTEIGHGGDNGFINTHGDGELHFRHHNNTVMSISDVGDMYFKGALSNGVNTVASGEYSVALGNDSEASGKNSFAGGTNAIAIDTNAFAFGEDVEANGSNSFVTGLANEAGGKNSFSTGRANNSNGDWSATFGYTNFANGLGSIAAGVLTQANGDYSMTLGNSTKATSFGSLVIGRYNAMPGTTPNTWEYDSTEPIFEAGVGMPGFAHNAMTISKRGGVGIGYSTPGWTPLTVYLDSAKIDNLNGFNPVISTIFRVDHSTRGNYMRVDVNDGIIVNKDSKFQERMEFFPLENLDYRLQLPNIATIADGTANAYGWHIYSDKRLKSNVRSLTYGLDEVLQLKPVSYTHRSSISKNDRIVLTGPTEETIGFLAQEVHSVIKEAARKPNDPESQLWTMDYMKLTPVLVQAIQDQQEIIEGQEQRISELERQFAEIKSLLQSVALRE